MTWSFVGVAALYATVMRLVLSWDLPLWLDESWTAVLSSAPTFQSFAHQMWLDSNAPLYYFLIWLWPFETNLGLRIPSIIFMLASSLVAILWAPVERKRALFWAALFPIWLPGVVMFLDARYYAFLFLLSTAQTIAYAALLTQPTLKKAAWWTGLATLATLTHYYAAIPALVQGLYYLWRYRGRALETWPAALLTAPAFGWFAYHWPRLKLYAEPETSWYETLDPFSAIELIPWPIGGGLIGAGILLLTILFWDRKPVPKPILGVCLTAFVATLIILGAATVLPAFVPRYLIPVAPPLLLGVAAVGRPAGFLPIAALMFIPMSSIDWSNKLQSRTAFGLERPAQSIPADRTVTWMIDYHGSRIHDGPQMATMLSDAFARNGRRVQARWGRDFVAGDALLLIYRTREGRRIPIPQWPCAAESASEHTILVCVKER